MFIEMHVCVIPLWDVKHKTIISLLQALKDVPRKAYYIGTKVARYEKDPRRMFDFSAEKTLMSVDHSLQLLGLEYVDIIQVSAHVSSFTML
jgi:aryl-alcohol dehydrogenase-like predicted oxidoreductase